MADFSIDDAKRATIIRTSLSYIQESEQAKFSRMEMNKRNFDIFHMRQDYSHKREGQSREFLPKQQLAVEQISSFFQQGLVDIGEWFDVEKELGVIEEDVAFRDHEITLLLLRQLEKAEFLTVVGDGTKSGLLGSLIILKVGMKKVPKVKFEVENVPVEKEKGILNIFSKTQTEQKLKRVEAIKKQLNIELIRQEDYYPDPTGNGLYEAQRMYMDFHKVLELSKGDDALFDPSVVNQLAQNFSSELEEKEEKARETNQDVVSIDFRKKVKIDEYWGDIVDSTTGEMLFKNVRWAVANDNWLIMPPKRNPMWHGESPFVVAPLTRVPNSVWHRAVMDAASQNNIALNELYNLIVDGGMMATHGIKQIRTDWLEDVKDVSAGIAPGTTLRVGANAPLGAKVMERVDTSSVSPESIPVFNIMQQEFNQSALTNDLRSGQLPQKSVKATEVVEASNSLTGLFTGNAKALEVTLIENVLRKSWITLLQEMDDLDSDEVAALLTKERALEISALSPEERFSKSVQGHKFRVFGITKLINKTKDFRKLTTLLQVVGSSEVFLSEFGRKFDFGKMLEEIMKSLDIDTEKLVLKPEEQQQRFEDVQQVLQSQQRNQQGDIPNRQSNVPAPPRPASQTSEIPRGQMARPPG